MLFKFSYMGSFSITSTYANQEETQEFFSSNIL